MNGEVSVVRAIILGILSALFFAVTFVLNASMEQAGGHWAWSASLRYFFMLPFLIVIVAMRKKFQPLNVSLRLHSGQWMLWSTIGFGLFYAPLCFAAMYAPGWLIAGTWQLTIIAGALLSPLFFIRVGSATVRARIPWRMLSLSIVVLIGIVLMQLEHAQHMNRMSILLGVLPIVIAAFMYPLGNRKMMALTDGRLGVFERILGMTLASLPFWLLLALYGFIASGLPAMTQLIQSFIVAVSSGVIATALFFAATDLVRGNMVKLAAVEATQAFEVLFALMGEMLLLSLVMPSTIGISGIIIVMIGMILQSIYLIIQARKIVNNTNI